MKKVFTILLVFLIGFQMISLSQISEIEPNNTFSQAMNVPLYTTISQTIVPSGDSDFFSVTVSKGGTLVIDVDNIPPWGWYSMPIELTVYSSDTMNVIANYFASGGPYYTNIISLPVLVCPGIYYLKVSTILNASSSNSFNTTISLDTTETCECNNYFAKACDAILGVTFPEKIYGFNLNDTLYGGTNGNDVDFYKVNVPLGGTLVINVDSIPDWGWYSMPVELTVYSSDTTNVIANYFASGGPYYTNTISLPVLVCPGIYYLKLSTILNASNSISFNTSISLDTTETCECNNYFATACDATLGVPFQEKMYGVNLNDTLYGGSNGNDIDFYKINATQSGTLNFDIDNIPGWGWYSMPVQLTIYSSDTFNIIANYFANGGPYYTNHIILDVPVCAGIYYLKVSTILNSSSSVSFQSTINFIPDTISFIANPLDICQGESSILTAIGNASNLIITPGNITSPAVVFPTTTTTYTVTGTSTNGCTLTSTLTINVTQLPIVTLSASSALICNGTSTNLTVGGTSSSITIQPGGFSSPALVTPTSTTTYTVIATGSAGCTNTATTTIIVNSLPTATVIPSGSTTFCQGGNVILNANSGSGLTYQWYKDAVAISGETSNSHSASISGSYYVVVTNTFNCSASSSPILVTVNPLPSANVTASGSTIFCIGGSVTLQANSGSGLTCQWFNASGIIAGATTNVYTANTTGIYYVNVTNTFNCSANSTSTGVTVNSLPTITISNPVPNDSICAGDSVILTATGTGTITWTSPVSNGIPFYPVSTSTYTATITDANYCTNTASTTIIVNPLPSIPVITNTGGVLSVPSGLASYQWYNNSTGIISGATNASFTPTTNGDFYVIITNAFGCKAQSLIFKADAVGIYEINSDEDIRIYPNPSYGNFTIELPKVTLNSKLYITDMLGNKVYEQILNEKKTNLTLKVSAGNYLIIINVDGRRFVRKLLVE